MNNIVTFAYNNTNVRTVTAEDNTPLFCANDVAMILEYSDPKGALDRHCRGVVKHYPIETPGGTQEGRFITEGDLYRLIFNSKLPTAEQFEAWVVDEVLPSIRKHGMYATPATIEEMIANPDIIIQLATTLKEERAARAKAEAEIEALGRVIETAEGDLTPSACQRPWDLTSSVDGSSTTTSHSATAKAKSSPCRMPSTEASSSSPNASTRPVRSGHNSSSHLLASPTSQAS